MAKTFLGFIAGVVLTSLAFVLTDQGAESTRSENGVSVLPQVSDVPIPLPGESRLPDPTPIDAEPSPEPAVAVDLEQDSIESIESLRASQADAYRAYALASEEYRQALASERWSAAEAPSQPIYLPPEFNYLAERPSEFHEQTQREDIDPVWSATTEAQIQDYFTRRPELTQKYGHPIINCRTTKCELAFVSYGLDESIREGSMWEGIPIDFATELRFRNENSEIYNQPWAEQFGFIADGEDGALISIEVDVVDEITTILWHLWASSD